MSLEITVRVNGLDCPREPSSDPSDGVVKALEELGGVQAVSYDSESRRFAVSYDPKRVTILRILSRIESAGRETGQTYRPIDVQQREHASFRQR